ncbi:MAG: OsmC family protein [Thermomicrobiales bacterium]
MPTPDTLKARQSTLKQGYRDDPDTALVTSAVHSTTPPGDDPTRVRISVDSPARTTLDIGAHVAVGGEDDLPCSGDIFLASLAACQEITIRMVANAMGLRLNRLAVRVEGDWDVRGTLAISREAPIGFTAIRVLVDLNLDASEEQRTRLLKSAERYCVVSQTLKNPPPVALVVRGEREA